MGVRLEAPVQGRLHNGGMVQDAPWRKLGRFCDDNDAFARVYNSLLLYELYTSALLTCCLPFLLY